MGGYANLGSASDILYNPADKVVHPIIQIPKYKLFWTTWDIRCYPCSINYHSTIIILCMAFCPSCPSQHAYGPKYLNSKCTVCSAVNKLILLSKLSIQNLTYEFLSSPGNYGIYIPRLFPTLTP